MNKAMAMMTFLVVFCLSTLWGQDPPSPTNRQISFPSTQLQNEEQVFYCPTDENIIVATWRDFRLGYRRCGIGRSTDGGNTWSDFLNGLMVTGGSYQSDPCMTVDKAGNFYCCYMDWEFHDALIVIKSTDKGETWQGPYNIIYQAGHFADKQFITCDRTDSPYDGNLYVAWSNFWEGDDSSNVMVARSTDGGVTFGNYYYVSPNRPIIIDGSRFYGSDLFAQPIVGSDGAVYIFYSGYDGPMETCDSAASMYMSKSTDGGITWPVLRENIYEYSGLRCRIVDGNIDVDCCPVGDADISGGPYTGNLYISTLIFVDEGSYNHSDVAMIKSTDGGVTWLDPVRVNDDPPGEDVDKFQPWLIVNEDGVIVTVFYDQRMDPNHYLFDLFAAYSFDGGETFTSNHRITEVSSSPAYLGKSGTLAEYVGVAAHHDNITAVWTDLRNGNQDVFSASYQLPLLRPRLYEIPDGSCISSEPDSLMWSSSWHVDDISYRLEISSDPAFGSFALSQTLTANKYFNPGLGLSDNNYYWRVKGFRTSVNDSTSFSEVWRFALDREAPSMAALVSPAEGSTTRDYSPEFIWSAPSLTVVAPESYEIEISDNDQFTGEGYYYHVDDIAETAHVLPQDLPGEGTYYWRVNHYDGAGNESGYSESAGFSVVNFVCGDANGDLGVNIGDVVYLANHVFRNGECATNPPIGCAPDPYEAGDVNCDGSVNIGDAVYLGNVIFRPGSPAPCAACP